MSNCSRVAFIPGLPDYELVALGPVTSDSFAGLRGLLMPSNQRWPISGAKRRGRILRFDIESGGRWALIRRAQPVDDQGRAAAIEHLPRREVLKKRPGPKIGGNLYFCPRCWRITRIQEKPGYELYKRKASAA
jgi:hypothetical protein